MQGDHLQLLLEGLLGSSRLPSHGALMGISAGLFLPTTWLPDLGALSYVGALGVVSALGLTGRGRKQCSMPHVSLQLHFVVKLILEPQQAMLLLPE